jgi:hypothetical protein
MKGSHGNHNACGVRMPMTRIDSTPAMIHKEIACDLHATMRIDNLLVAPGTCSESREQSGILRRIYRASDAILMGMLWESIS